jgi:hypothetical protein
VDDFDPAWAAGWTEAHLPEMSGVTFGEAVRHLAPHGADRLRRLRSGTRSSLATRSS